MYVHTTGLLSKSRGQVLRVAAIFHMLFGIDENRYHDATTNDEI